MASTSIRILLLTLAVSCGAPTAAPGQASADADVKDCKDHPLFTRMADTHTRDGQEVWTQVDTAWGGTC